MTAVVDDVQLVALDDIIEAPDNPRTHLDGIEELAASIAQLGQLVPIIVEERPRSGRYDLLAGHRRCAALRHLGHTRARAQIRTGPKLNGSGRLALMLAENAQRRPLDPIDEANAYRQLLEKHRTQSEVATIIGVNQVYVSRRLELLKLSPRDQERVRTGELTLTAARALANPDPRKRAPRGTHATAAKVDPDEANTITFAVTDKEWAELERRRKAQNITVQAFARAALQRALRS